MVFKVLVQFQPYQGIYCTVCTVPVEGIVYHGFLKGFQLLEKAIKLEFTKILYTKLLLLKREMYAKTKNIFDVSLLLNGSTLDCFGMQSPVRLRLA
jgi:hypothetical protein